LANLGRPDALPARLGGEEFAVLLAAATSEQAGQIADEILAAVANRPFCVDDATLHITVSLGLSIVQPGDGPLTLLRRADDALYASKHAGRNCGHLHDGETCRPIHGDQTPTTPGEEQCPHEETDSPPAGDVELLSLVDDLRTRLTALSLGP
jgi:predicted signal transduction protein with EAL and GGDEF domain